MQSTDPLYIVLIISFFVVFTLKKFVKKMQNNSINPGRSLFGTDFYMVTTVGDFHKILECWDEYVPESIDIIMKKDNPYRFFFR